MTILDHRTSPTSIVGDFESMVQQMRDTLNTLEGRVANRTRDLLIASEVSRQIATILTVDELLPEVVELTKSNFDLYHAHIYLLAEDEMSLVLAAGAGEAGRLMSERGHRIPLSREHSLVVRAARTRQGVISNNVSAELDFLPNPMLPDTQSEMPIPMVVGDTLIGILDVQADTIDRFNDDDLRVQTSLAAQVAVAIQNARAYARLAAAEHETLRRATELETIASMSTTITRILDVNQLLQSVADMTQANFNLYHAHIYLLDEYGENLVLAAGSGAVGRQMVKEQRIIPYNREDSLVATAARTLQGIIANDVMAEPNFLPHALLPQTRSEMAIPMLTGDTLIGVLDVQSDEVDHFTDFNVSMKTTLAGQVAVAVQNARAFTQVAEAEHETRRRATELETIAGLSTTITSILNVNELLQMVATATKENFDLYHAHIYLLDEAGENLVLAAGAGEIGKQMVSEKHSIPYNRQDSLVATAARSREGVIVNNVTKNPNFLPHPLLPNTRSEMAIPMVVGDTLIGVLDVQSDEFDHFTDFNVSMKTTLASQIAVAVQNARTFSRVAEAQAETRRIFDLSLDMIGTIGFDGYFKALNPAWENTLGFSNAEILATPFIDFVHPDDVDRTNAEAARLGEGAMTLDFENRYKTYDGSYKWMSWHVVPDIDRGLMYCVTRDITEKRNVNLSVKRCCIRRKNRPNASASQPNACVKLTV